MLGFLDAFLSYNKILMHPDDEEKMLFMLERGTYCYKKMPFGLKNAKATFQRLTRQSAPSECIQEIF